jgi:Fic family protein
MDPKDFTSDRAGQVIRNEHDEWAFIPHSLPVSITFLPALINALSQAERSLGAWAGLCKFPGLFDLEMYSGPMIRLEAALSSRIEGTRTTLREVLLLEASADGTPATSDARLVKNLSDAILYGWKHIRKADMDIAFICGLHKHLLHGVRGDQIQPGLIRDEQVYVRSGAQTIAEADFVPPPADQVFPLLQSFVTYVRTGSDLPDLIRIGLVHYQFETIHPFMDGNGRVGRLLITLLMAKWGLLPMPVLNLSKYFLTHRKKYANHLLRVSQKGEYEEWLQFFLAGVAEQSEVSFHTIRRLGDLRARWQKEIIRPRMPGRLPDLVNLLFTKPFLKIQDVSAALEVSFSDASRLIQELVGKGILFEKTGRKRDRIFEARKVLDILTRLERI